MNSFILKYLLKAHDTSRIVHSTDVHLLAPTVTVLLLDASVDKLDNVLVLMDLAFWGEGKENISKLPEI